MSTRNRYTVRRVKTTDPLQADMADDLTVQVNDDPEYKWHGVWRNFHSDGTVDVACASCSTRLRGMSASCVHAKAAKYATLNGTVQDEQRPKGWKPQGAKVHAKHAPVTNINAQSIPRQPTTTNLPVTWKQHQPSAGPSLMRAYVGPHKVGNVTRSMVRNGGYVPSCFLPGAAVHTTLPTEQDAMAEVERVVRLWFEAIPHLEIL